MLVLLAYFIEIAVSSIQAVIPTSLISCFGIMLINLSFFLTMESPDVHLIELLRKEKERADEANNAKSMFLSNMSHEIRTPMNAIVGLTDVMLRKDLPPDERGYMLNIKSSGKALLNLINDLLDFSKIEAGKFTISEDEYNIVPMLRDICLIGRTRIGGKGSEFYFTVLQGITDAKEIGVFDEHGSDDGAQQDHFDFTAPEANILLVEDNEINCEAALALLEPLEMKIDTAENGAKALEKLESKKYNLVFMDQFMPVMDGMQAVRKIREKDDDYYRSLPVIALTADAVSGVRDKFIDAGMDDFLSKPIDMKDMCAKLKKWLPNGLIKYNNK